MARETTLRIMARINTFYLENPCRSIRCVVDYLVREGIVISRDRVRNLMQRMSLQAIHYKPCTTVATDPSVQFPCLAYLRQVKAGDQTWTIDIPYIPLRKGFLYLVAIMDLHSRHLLFWKLSNSHDTEFFLGALDTALTGWRKPQIFSSDRGYQPTSVGFVARPQAGGSRSASQTASPATKIYWVNASGGSSSARRGNHGTTAMAGELESALPASC
jgi:putative transposase